MLSLMFSSFLTITLVTLFTLTSAAPTPAVSIPTIGGLSPYAPYSTSCPSSPLVRPATSLNAQEAAYVALRAAKANIALAAFSNSILCNSTSSATTSTTSTTTSTTSARTTSVQSDGKWYTYTKNDAKGFTSTTTKSTSTKSATCPASTSTQVIGFTSSGGGYRSLLTTAGVVEAFDNRESNFSVAGVYQALTYQAGLSGGSWFLSSLAANNWPTISSLQHNLWEQAFQNSLLLPANLLSPSDDAVYVEVTADVAAKQAAGYEVSIVDPYGRLLSYQLLYGADGGVADRLSGLTTLSNFTAHNVPYPIITTTTDFPNQGECYPTIDGPIFEFHPYEYGSWDQGVSAFAQTLYMGTNITDGQPTNPSSCTANYDNIGYIFGTSADVFNGLDGGQCYIPPVGNSTLEGVLEGIVAEDHLPTQDDLFGIYPNPFYQYPRSTLVENQTELTLSDGGEGGQNNPIWPFIQPERHVDVLIVNDNSADTTDNFPNGTEIRQTYLNAQKFGLPKMPYIPPVATFVAEGLNKRATFFGCGHPSKLFIVYLPNVNYTYPSNQPTSKIEYTIPETDGMIANGNAIATQNGDEQWPFCLACALDSKEKNLPEGCKACFAKYCYRR